MSRVCLPCDPKPSEPPKVIPRVAAQINAPQEQLAIRRALRNVNPNSRRLYWCMKRCTDKALYNEKCELKEVYSAPSLRCDCKSMETWELEYFINLHKSKCYTQKEIDCFVEVIEGILSEEFHKRVEVRHCKQCRAPDYCIVPVVMRNCDESSELTEVASVCVSIKPPCNPTCPENKMLTSECKPRHRKPLFSHYGYILKQNKDCLRGSQEPFRIGDLGASEEVAKWGPFFDLVERVLRQLDRVVRLKFSSSHSSIQNQNSMPPDGCCEGEMVCVIATKMPRRKEDLQDVDRYKHIDLFGMSTFSRGVVRWSNCITKRWNCIVNHPHVVIHLPSMGYPCHLRCSAHKKFDALQNVQIGRIGWLANEYSDVIYVCPGRSNFETRCTLESLVRMVRPDADMSRLWIIVNDSECLCKHIDQEYRSGCETLFYTPNVYGRVRNLTAGRHAFIIPGILSETDVFIACELKTSIVAPCLSFQQRLLNKRYVMSLLVDAQIPHPPFVPVRNYSDLCDKLALVIMTVPRLGMISKKWLLKVNCGFYGNQNAFICLEFCDFCVVKDLSEYLAKILPKKLKVNKAAYKDSKDFFVELERHGGILMTCPPANYRTISLGGFIEHDLAQAIVRTTADVIQYEDESGYIRTDFGYIIPQVTVPEEMIRDIVIRIGDILQDHLYLGFFGIDIVVFQEEGAAEEVLSYWVVDIDPYYTDLISFDDWRRFCLNAPNKTCFTADPDVENSDKVPPKNLPFLDPEHRFVVCSGKLFVDGLSLTSGTFLIDLCKKHQIAYSSKAKAGTMIYPVNNERKAFLVFSIARSRDIALQQFVHALKALHIVSVEKSKPSLIFTTKMLEIATKMIKTYNIILTDPTS